MTTETFEMTVVAVEYSNVIAGRAEWVLGMIDGQYPVVVTHRGADGEFGDWTNWVNAANRAGMNLGEATVICCFPGVDRDAETGIVPQLNMATYGDWTEMTRRAFVKNGRVVSPIAGDRCQMVVGPKSSMVAAGY